MPDPGADSVRWHKTDHRMAAMNTLDAVRAAEWHLYFPNQRLQQGLEPWRVPELLFYYVLDRDANVWVNVDPVMDRKIEASLSHVSQFEPAVRKYRPDWRPEDRKKAEDEVRSMLRKRDGHFVESFRYAVEFNQY
jgi:LmbE family N-acetylglucosaminyl deacetylase